MEEEGVGSSAEKLTTTCQSGEGAVGGERGAKKRTPPAKTPAIKARQDQRGAVGRGMGLAFSLRSTRPMAMLWEGPRVAALCGATGGVAGRARA